MVRLSSEWATTRIPETIRRSLAKVGLDIADVDHIIPHQPGVGVLRKTADVMGIPFGKFHINMDRVREYIGGDRRDHA